MEGVNLEDYQVGVIGVTRKLTTIEFGMEFNAVHQLSYIVRLITSTESSAICVWCSVVAG